MTEANARIIIDKLLRDSDWILSGDDGVAGVSGFTNSTSTNGDFLRTITFGQASRHGEVYVRAGWKVSGGTNQTDIGAGSSGTRMFKYIELT